MMKKEWNLRMKGCALLLSVFLLASVGCTSKNSIVSVEEETSSTETFSLSSEEEEGLYNNWRKKSESLETEQGAETVESENPGITESEAKDRVLAEVLRISGAEDPEVDQTSAKILNENEDAYLVSIDIYEKSAGTTEESGNTSGSQTTELYRVDKKTGEVNYLTKESDFQ